MPTFIKSAQPRFTLTNGNTKLGKGIPAINMPQGVTCNPKAPCFKGCYATRGHFVYKAVKECYNNNYQAYLTNPKQFFKDVANQTKLFSFVRVHASGDCPDVNYLKGLVWVAKQNPQTTYLMFTKQYKIVNDYMNHAHKIPSNLRIVFSTWLTWVPENPYNFPTTWVRFPETGKTKELFKTSNGLIPKNAFQCTGYCPDCLKCWKVERGESVVFKKH